jgi:uroporphyrinogen-III synthase
MRPTILVTRPDPDGPATARALARATGLPVVESPLLRITPGDALPDLTGIATLILTSRNAAHVYAALGGPARPALCIGEATAEAARAAGLAATALGGDAEALVADLLRTRPGGALMHLRGAASRGNIAARLSAAGLTAREAVIYRQDLCPLNEEAQARLAARKPLIVTLYSPRTAAHFADVARPRAPLHIVAMSPAVARAAAPLGADSMTVAEAPDAPAMIRAVVATVRRVEGMGRPD